MNKIHFPQLSPRSVCHPWDFAAYELLAKAKFLPEVLGFISKHLMETPRKVELMSTSLKVSSRQWSHIHDMTLEACRILDVSPPDTYVRASPQLNAYTSGIHEPIIVLYTGLLDLLDDDEVQVIIAHELGHIKAQHVLYHTVLDFALVSSVDLIASMPNSAKIALSAGLGMALTSWLRKCELSADRAALLVAQSPETVVSAFMKLAGGAAVYRDRKADLSTDEFLLQSRQLEYMIRESKVGFMHFITTSLMQDHPLVVPRASILYEWSQTDEYPAILEGRYAQTPPKQCPSCEREIAANNYICPWCEARFRGADLTSSFICSGCNSYIDSRQLDEDARFCPSCGQNTLSSTSLFSSMRLVS